MKVARRSLWNKGARWLRRRNLRQKKLIDRSLRLNQGEPRGAICSLSQTEDHHVGLAQICIESSEVLHRDVRGRRTCRKALHLRVRLERLRFQDAVWMSLQRGESVPEKPLHAPNPSMC